MSVFNLLDSMEGLFVVKKLNLLEMKGFLVLIFLVFINYTTSTTADFTIKLTKNKSQCFGEHLLPNTLVKLSITPEDSNSEIFTTIEDEQKQALIPEPLVGQVNKYTFTTSKAGAVSVCIVNVGTKPAKIHFEMMTGTDAGDVTQAPSEVDFKPIERYINKTVKLLKSIKQKVAIIVSNEDSLIAAEDSIPSKLYFFTFITLTIIIAVSFVQLKYLQSFFRKKKLI